MSLKPRFVLLAFLSLLLVLAGCGDQATDPTDDGDPGTLHGNVSPNGSDFEITIETAGGQSDPILGPFVLRGSNIHYDDAIGALVVDLSVINRGRLTHREPVTLTFRSLLPADVTIINPDGDRHGPGAWIEFGFANDDGVWTPGEESFPRPVQFNVGPGTSIGFTARLDVGRDPTGGLIGGVVWNDINEDGVRDNVEVGIEGVIIGLELGGDGTPGTDVNSMFHTTRTNARGVYWFANLRPGFYTVHKLPAPWHTPTTPTTIRVVLVEENGTVSDFRHADFGCLRAAEPPPREIMPGDFLAVLGNFLSIETVAGVQGSRILARHIDAFRCPLYPPPIISPPCLAREWFLAGPVTGIHLAERLLVVMGVEMFIPRPKDERDDYRVADLFLEDVQIGDRVRVHLEPNDTTNVFGPPIGHNLTRYDGTAERVHAVVRHIMDTTTGGNALAILDIGLDVLITPDTPIEWPEAAVPR